MEDNEFEATMEEYKHLREEILYFFNKEEQSQNFALLIALGIMGLGDKFKVEPLIIFVSASVIFILWLNEIRRMKGIFRIATYIEVKIEPKLKGLQWETLVGKHPIQKSWKYRILEFISMPLLILLVTVFGFIQIFENADKCKALGEMWSTNTEDAEKCLKAGQTLVIWIALIVTSILSVAFYFMINNLSKLREKERKYWTNVSS